MDRKIDILLIEDNPQDAELAILALKTCGLGDSLLHLEDGQAALDFLLGEGIYQDRSPEQFPQVVFLDLKLPKVDGLEVLESLRKHPDTALLPVVMFTSSCQESDIEEAYRLGVNSYIVKPVDFDAFSETVGMIGRYWLHCNSLRPGAAGNGNGKSER